MSKTFDCVKCSQKYTSSHNFIIYDLCDACFAGWDNQKMTRRFGAFGMVPMPNRPYFENFDKWLIWAEENPVQFQQDCDGGNLLAKEIHNRIRKVAKQRKVSDDQLQ